MINEFLPISRAARLVAPISPSIEKDNFSAGIDYIIGGDGLMSRHEIQSEPVSEMPSHSVLYGATPLSVGWYQKMNNAYIDGIANRDKSYKDWMFAFRDWVDRDQISVSRADIENALRHPSGGYHAPIENVNAVGSSWNFPETLAWIATRDALEVAHMRYSEHWAAPMDASISHRMLAQSDNCRRLLIGWLVIATAEKHCKCSSQRTAKKERWENCRCVGEAYVALRQFANGTIYQIPEYQPKPVYGYFTLTWPDDAHNLTFLRKDVLAQWPKDKTNHQPVAVSTPRLPVATLNNWWEGLSDSAKEQKQDDLWEQAKKAYSTHSISRQRIRELTGPRKRGVKPLRGNESA